MAQKSSDDSVTLVGPSGDEVTVKSPAAVNNYVYGQGYQPKKGTVEEAVEKVTPNVADASPTAEPQKTRG